MFARGARGLATVAVAAGVAGACEVQSISGKIYHIVPRIFKVHLQSHVAEKDEHHEVDEKDRAVEHEHVVRHRALCSTNVACERARAAATASPGPAVQASHGEGCARRRRRQGGGGAAIPDFCNGLVPPSLLCRSTVLAIINYAALPQICAVHCRGANLLLIRSG